MLRIVDTTYQIYQRKMKKYNKYNINTYKSIQAIGLVSRTATVQNYIDCIPDCI